MSASGTHNFFADLYKNFTIYSFLMISMPFLIILYSAYNRSSNPASEDEADLREMFIIVLITTSFGFAFSSYLSRSMMFPLMVSIAYFVATTTKASRTKKKV